MNKQHKNNPKLYKLVQKVATLPTHLIQ